MPPRRSFFAAVALYAVVTVGLFASAPREILVAHTAYNHFSLLADAWLHGRLDLGGAPPAYTGNNDFALYGERTFVSFPPFPAILLVPLVKLAGSPERVRDGQVFLWLAGVAPAALFLALDALSRSGRSPRSEGENLALGALFAFGSVYWFTAVQGTVWFAAHVVGAALASLYLFCSIDARHPLGAGLALALGFATRTPLLFAAPLFVFETLRSGRRAGGEGPLLRLAVFAAPIALVGALLAWHNAARFGDALEFGHRHLAIGWRPRIERWGLFSYHYLGRNLAVMLTSLPFGRVSGAPFQINVHGLALWITTPIYAWALWPRRVSGLFWALAATAGAVALPSLLYQNSGWTQFGYRFSNDFAPFLFAMIAVGGRRFGPAFWVLSIVGVLVNGFGAFTFQRAGYERFYFVDHTQKILHQPD